MEERRLTAILFSDISGYTALMRENEEYALSLLDKSRRLHRTVIKTYHGKIIDEIGDGIFACFNSALNAVECAIELIRLAKNEEALNLHVGLHLAEVIFSGEKAYGDGVNLASRILSMAKEGEILASEDIYRNIRNHDEITARDLGDQHFKNINEPVRIYRLETSPSFIPGMTRPRHISDTREEESRVSRKYKRWIPFAVIAVVVLSGLIYVGYDLMTKKPPEGIEKTIAVLPFKNYSPDPASDYFSDGMTEEVINYLSKIRDLKVISRTSVEQYKNSSEDVQKIARELGVSNILEGSVRKDSNKVRITVQLIQARSGFHLWSDEYDRELAGIFEVQTDIAREVAGVLAAVLTEKEKMLIEKRSSVSLTAYDFYMKAKEEFMNYKMGNGNTFLDRAISLYHRALEVDNKYAPAYAGLGWTYYGKNGLREYFSENYLDSVKIMGEKALDIDQNCEEAHALLGHYYYEMGDFDKALAEIEMALEINPNYIEALWLKSDIMCYSKGDFVEGINFSLKTVELYHGPDYENLLKFIGTAYQQIGILDRAEYYFSQSISLSGDSTNLFSLRSMIARYEGNYDDMLQYAGKICPGDTFNYNCGDLLSWGYTLVKQYRQALNIWLSGDIEGMSLNNGHRIGYLYQQLGDEKKANEYFMRQIRYGEESIRLQRSYGRSYRAQYDLAALYAYLNDKEKAYAYLKEVADNIVPLYWLSILVNDDPMFDSLRGEERFESEIKKIIDRFNAERKRVLEMVPEPEKPVS